MIEKGPTRLVIVDDDPLVLLGLSMLLEHAPGIELVGSANDGSGVIAVVADSKATALLMDIQMPGTSGFSIMAALRNRFPDLRIVLMTAHAPSRFEPHALALGADAFIRKTASAQEFVDSIRGWSRDLSHQAQLRGRSLARLSARETEVGRKIALGRTNDEIAYELGVSVNTVKTYTSRLFAKLHVTNRVQLANLLNGIPVERSE